MWAHPLAPNPRVVMASREHARVGVPSIPLKKRLLDEPFILREPGSGTRDAVLRLFESKGLTPPVARMEFSSNEAIKQAVRAGLGITRAVLAFLKAWTGTAGAIAVLDVPGFPLQRHGYVVYPKRGGNCPWWVRPTCRSLSRRGGRSPRGWTARSRSASRQGGQETPRNPP